MSGASAVCFAGTLPDAPLSGPLLAVSAAAGDGCCGRVGGPLEPACQLLGGRVHQRRVRRQLAGVENPLAACTQPRPVLAPAVSTANPSMTRAWLACCAPGLHVAL